MLSSAAMPIPAYPRQSLSYGPREWTQAAGAMLRAGRGAPTGGYVAGFERALAAAQGQRQGVAFPSGRAAIYFTLKALDEGDGRDEVVLPAYTFWIVPVVVAAAGFVPVAVDVDRQSFLLDPERVVEALGERTRAIVVAHLNGRVQALDRLKGLAEERGIALIEDACQAFGATRSGVRAGATGIGCHAFGPGKAISTLGGGAVTTDDEGLAGCLRELRDTLPSPVPGATLSTFVRALVSASLSSPWLFSASAWPVMWAAQALGSDSVESALDDDRTKLDLRPMEGRVPALSEAQAAAGMVQLERAQELISHRRRNAAILRRALDGIDDLELPEEDSGATWLHFTLRSTRRDELVRRALALGVDLQKDYCSLWPELPILRNRCRVVSLEQARRIPDEVAYVPTHPTLSARAMQRIAGRLRRACGAPVHGDQNRSW